jgi:hypothetical protein
MIDGTLMINLNPPCAGFSSESGKFWKNCTVDELRALLIELGGLAPEQAWPPGEYVLRMPGRFLRDTLTKFGLIKMASVSRVSPPWNSPQRFAASA